MNKYMYISDVHHNYTVFKHYESEEYKDVILILAGDVREFGKSKGHELMEALRYISSLFGEVIYVPGNHEYYSKYLDSVDDSIREGMSDVYNFHMLQGGEYMEIDGVRIIGATLWTDLKGCENTIQYMMNDYRYIKIHTELGRIRLIRPSDTLALHKEHVAGIQKALSDWEGPSIVVTHHAPSFGSLAEKFRGSSINGGFISELELDKWPDYWVHGHVHNVFNYMHKGCNILCNPVGYSSENTEYNLTTNEFKL